MKACRLIAASLFVLALPAGSARLAGQSTPADGVTLLLRQIERIVQAGDAEEDLNLLAETADRADAGNFARSEVVPGATRVTVKERARDTLRGTLPGNGYRLSVDVFVEFGPRARNATWQLDVKRSGDTWRIDSQERMTQVENLNRLSLNPS